MRDVVEAAAEGAREGFTEVSKSRKNQDDIDEENAQTIAIRRSKGIMTRGRLSGKGEEDCDKDRKSDIDKAKI